MNQIKALKGKPAPVITNFIKGDSPTMVDGLERLLRNASLKSVIGTLIVGGIIQEGHHLIKKHNIIPKIKEKFQSKKHLKDTEETIKISATPCSLTVK